MNEPTLKSQDELVEFINAKIQAFPLLVFAGLVKNAGKTTALNVINSLRREESLGLTSIGYDGEPQDAVYRHPKPPIQVFPGQLILTAEQFLPKELEGYEVLERWGSHAQFGSWLIVRITSATRFRMAGPANLPELREGILRLKKAGAKRIYIDGALNRLSHVSFDKAGIILSTGAALGNSLEDVTQRTLHVLQLFQLPVTFEPLPPSGQNFFLTENNWFSLPRFLWTQDLKQVLPQKPDALYLHGAFTDKLYLLLLETKRLPRYFVVDTPAQILLSQRVWQGLKSRGIGLFLSTRPELILLTLNSWHPLTPIATEQLAEALLLYSHVPLVDLQQGTIHLPSNLLLSGGDGVDTSIPSQ